MSGPVLRILRAAGEGAVHFHRSHGMVYSAAVAFNFLLAAIPVLFLAFAAASLVIGKSELPYAQLTEMLGTVFPYGVNIIVPSVRRLIGSSTAIGIAGLVLLLLSSHSATDAVHTSLRVMIGPRGRRRFGRSAAFHVGLVLTLTVLTFAAILVHPLAEGLAVLTRRARPQGINVAASVFLHLASDVALVAIVLVGGAVSYRYLSPERIRWRYALGGSAAFLALLALIRGGFAFYVKKFSRLNIIYGSLFGFICFIIVAYLFAAAYLYVASVVGVLHRTAGEESAHPGGDARGTA